MKSSAYYAAIIEELEAVKGQISGLFEGLESLSSAVTKGASYTSKLEVNGDTIDKGELDKLSSSLTDVATNLNAIITECDTKIAEYEILYEQALAREEEAEESDGTSTTSNAATNTIT